MTPRDKMPYSKQTYVFKTVRECQLHADVYRSENGGERPGVIWLHGGGLVLGNRGMISPEQIELYIKAGYIVISVDYRLAPETKLKEILIDVRDAYEWVYEKGPVLFGVDATRLVVVGHSAGGYLALAAGAGVYPRPKALISFYGYGDITRACFREPDAHYAKAPIISREVAYQGLSPTVISESQFAGFNDKRWQFYLFCRQQGLWMREVTGYNSFSDNRVFDSLCPVRNISQDYPPTLLLHGDKDTDVPFEASSQIAAALSLNHVEHQFIILKGLGHMFDRFPGLDDPKVAKAFDAVLAFLRRHVGS